MSFGGFVSMSLDNSLTFEQYSDVIHDIGGKLFKVIDKSDGVQRFLNRPSIGSRCCLTRDHVLKRLS